MRLALLIALLMAPMVAHAEPVTAAIAIFAAWAGTTAGIIAITATVLSAGMAIYGSAQARRAERDARNAANAAMQDRLATRIATESPHRYVYGRAKVGADIVAMFTSGDKDQYKHIVCVLAAHECDAVEEVYVNNVAVGLRNSSGDATTGRFAPIPGTEVFQESKTGPTFTISKMPVGAVQAFTMNGIHMTQVAVTAQTGRSITVASSGTVIVNYQYNVGRRFGETVDETVSVANSPYVRVQIHLGTPTDLADAYLMSVVPSKWTSTSVLRGLCYMVVTLDLNNPEFQGGQVPIHALVRGKKLYDPRTALTAWSANPPLAIYDYLTSPLCGVSAADLPVAQFITAANACDDAVVVAGGRYTINGTVTSDQDQSHVLETMAQCMAGGIVSTTWDIYAGKYVAPVIALDQSDIVGALSITPGVSDAAIYNGVKGQFISPDNSHVLTDFTPYQNPTYRTADGRDLYTNIDFPFTNALQRVHNIARIFTEDQRAGFTLKAEFSLKAWPIKVGQRVTFTSAFLGQSAKIYRVTDKSYAPNSAVELTLKEDAASIWDFADATVLDSTPNTNLPDPWAIAPLASLTCTSGVATLLTQADGSIVPRILVTWPAATTQTVFTNGQIEVEWRAISTDTWQKAVVSGSATETYLSPITPGYFYVIRARTVNPYLNVKSNWVMVTYQVEVFSARPVVYKWADAKPATPTGAASYTWSTLTYGAAPASWSLTIPTKPTTGADVSLWVASPLVENISATGSTAFDWSTATVSAVGYSAAAAVAAAAAAQATADAANTALTAIANDNLLSKGEKPEVILRWNTIVGEVGGIQGQADALAVSRASFDSNYTTLLNYLNSINTAPAWTDVLVDTPITGTTFRTNFLNYYNAKAALVAALTDKAAFAPSLTIGGRNLYKKTTILFDGGGPAPGSVVGARTASGFSLNGIATNNGCVRMDDIIPRNGVYTISFDLAVSFAAGSPLTLDFCDLIPWTINPTTVVQHFSRTFEVVNYSPVYDFIDFNGLSAQTYNFANFSLVGGSKDTGWTPAPEDVAADTAAAQSAANAANSALALIADDDVLSRAEKPAVIKEWAITDAEAPLLRSQADSLTVSRTAYDAAKQTLSDYLISIPNGWNTLTTDSAIVGVTFRSKWTDYYAAKVSLLNAIATETAKRAVYASVTGRPDDTLNLVLKSSFENGLTEGWDGAVVAVSGQIFTKALQVSARDSFFNSGFPVTPGEVLYVEADLDASSAAYALTIGARFNNSAGATVSWTSGATIAAAIGWTHVKGSLTVPAGAVTGNGWLQINGSTGFGTGRATNIRITRFQSGATSNIVTSGASAPSLSANGDIWIDTNAPVTIKTRVAGAWVAGGNVPTSLSHVNSTEASKLSGVAAGATANIVSTGVLSARPTGADGDFYYATDTSTLYQKVAGVWGAASTVGAPAGTNVGSTPAATVESGAAAGTTAKTAQDNKPVVSINSSSVQTAKANPIVAGSAVNAGTAIGSATGANGGLVYQWSVVITGVSPDNEQAYMSIGSPTSLTTTFSIATTANTQVIYTATLTVTDAKGFIGSASFSKATQIGTAR